MNPQKTKHVLTFVTVLLAAAASLGMYERYTTKPWTRDGQVRANVVGVASRVAGPIIQIPIRDNQSIKKGDLLFEIDPSTYIAAVKKAQAKLLQTQAAEIQANQELARQTELFKTRVTDLRDLQNAQDSFAAAQANTAAAQAELDYANLNLGYTKIFAPVDGYITNMNTSPGTYVYAGQQLLALVDANSFWVAAYFKETQLITSRREEKPRSPSSGAKTSHSKERSKAWLGVYLILTDRLSISFRRSARPWTGCACPIAFRFASALPASRRCH
jgi:RND family efflux transporter MFP subunit